MTDSELGRLLAVLCDFAEDPRSGESWPAEALAPLRELAAYMRRSFPPRGVDSNCEVSIRAPEHHIRLVGPLREYQFRGDGSVEVVLIPLPERTIITPT